MADDPFDSLFGKGAVTDPFDDIFGGGPPSPGPVPRNAQIADALGMAPTNRKPVSISKPTVDLPELTGAEKRRNLREAQEQAAADAEAMTVRPDGTFDYYVEFFKRGIQGWGSGVNTTAAIILDTMGANELAHQQRVKAYNRGERASVSVEGETTGEEVWEKPTFSNVANFIAETGIESTPEMFAAIASIPVYVASISGRTADTRSKNNGETEADLTDLMASLPTSVVSAYLDRLPLQAIFGGKVGRTAAGRVLGGAGIEGITEFAQSGVEYAGGTLGTEAGFDSHEAIKQSILGAVAGTGIGGGLAGGVEIAQGGAALVGKARERTAFDDMFGAPEPDASREAVRALDPGSYDTGENRPMVPLNQGDVDSSLPTEAIQAGKNIIGDLLNERPAIEPGTVFADPVAPPATSDARSTFKAKVRAAESGGNDQAKNPNSTATGRYQFTKGTWEGLGGVWSKRTDPGEQERLMDKLTSQNEAALSKAGNMVTPGNLYLAHFLGAGGAIEALANPNDQVSEAVQKANPFTKGWTNGRLAAWATRKMGGKAGEWTNNPNRAAEKVWREQDGAADGENLKPRQSSEAFLKEVLGDDILEPSKGERVEVTQNGETVAGTVEEAWEIDGRKGARIALDDGTVFDEALDDAREFGAKITKPVTRSESRTQADSIDYRKRANEIADAAYASGQRTGTMPTGETWTTAKNGWVTVNFPEDGYEYSYAGTTDKPIIGDPPGPFAEPAAAPVSEPVEIGEQASPNTVESVLKDTSKPVKADPVALVPKLREIISGSKISLSDIKKIAASLGVTEKAARAAMGVLASQPNSGFYMTKGRPPRRNKSGRVIQKAIPPTLRRVAKRTKPLTAMEFVRSMGGVQSQSHNLRNLGAVGRYPGVISKKGRTVDEIGQALHEAGYFTDRDPGNPDQRPTVAETLDFLERASLKRAYTANEQPEPEREEADEGEIEQRRAALAGEFEANGYEFSEEEMADAQRYIDSGSTVEDAVYAAIYDGSGRTLDTAAEQSGDDDYLIERDAIYEGSNEAEADESRPEESVPGFEGDEGNAQGRGPPSAQPDPFGEEAEGVAPPRVTDEQFKATWSSKAFKPVRAAADEPHRESPVAAELVRGYLDGKDGNTAALAVEIANAARVAEGVRGTGEGVYNPRQSYLEGYYAGATGATAEVRAKGGFRGILGPIDVVAATTDSIATTDKPLAAEGLDSYRYKGPFGWIMIGAKSEADALREANRSLETPNATRDNLEAWNGTAYAPVAPAADVLAERPNDQRTALERQGEGRMRSTKRQKAPGEDGGLFDVQDTTGDMFDAPVAPASTFGASNTRVSAERAAELRAAIKAKMRKPSDLLGDKRGAFDAELLAMGLELADFYIEGGVRKFADFAKRIADDLGMSMAELKPYLRAWYNGARDSIEDQGGDTADMDGPGAVRAAINMIPDATESAPVGGIVDAEGPTDVSSAAAGVEPDRAGTAVADAAGEAPVRNQAGSDGVDAGRGRGGTDAARSGPERGRSLFDDLPAVVGTGSPDSVRAGQPAVRGRTDAGGEPGRSAGDRQPRQADERIGPSAVAATADRAQELAAKEAAQQAAANIRVVPGDLANIAATLPYLTEQQHGDVLAAEQRLKVGEGMLFTNGTGTGKTFTGGGVVARFVRQGKKSVLIVAPSQGIMSDWIKALAKLGVTATPLESTNDRGKGVSITTYANMANNPELSMRDFDLVVPDESHTLMSAKDADATRNIEMFRALTNHPKGRNQRARNQLHKQWAPFDAIRDAFHARPGNKNRNWMVALDEGQKEALRALDERTEELARNFDEKPRSKVVFLSATPFAYVKNIEYAEGYLFDYGEDQARGRMRGYNEPDPREAFFIQHFGYRMRNNKLTQPDAGVDNGVMEREFHEHLKKSGALSGRVLEENWDYDRKFVLIDDAIGNDIDKALTWLRENRRFAGLEKLIRDQFSYLNRMRLLEAIKAHHAVPYIRQNLALGRKVVVFHDYNQGSGFSPFDVTFIEGGKDVKKQIEAAQGQVGVILSADATTAMLTEDGKTVIGEDKKPREVLMRDLYDEFVAANPYVKKMDFASMRNPIETMKAAFPDALIYNGTVSKGRREQAKVDFNRDGSSANIIVVQAAAGQAGISLHDTTGKHQRVLINLGMPVRPTAAIQEEGRIYRIGQQSNAAFRYFNTGTTWERHTFASVISERASTAENLALGNLARTLKQSFIDAFIEADTYPPSAEDGIGGKERDKGDNTLSEFQRSKTFYWAQQKRRGGRDKREGVDYFATPEPVGFKMGEWANLAFGEKVLEPSAGHGAIARFLPERADRTLVEPSEELATKAELASPGARIVISRFEELNVGANKFHGIVMNPPFGVGGKTAFDHVTKAAQHLRNGGRLVALVPAGPSADKRYEAFREAHPDLHLIADVALPSVTFERAGTAVSTHVIVFEKHKDKAVADSLPEPKRLDLTGAGSVNELFDRLENVDLPPRRAPLTEDAPELGAIPERDKNYVADGIAFRLSIDAVKPARMLGSATFKRLAGLAEKYGGRYDRLEGFSFDPSTNQNEPRANRDEFLRAVAAGEKIEQAAPTVTGVPSGATYDLGETVHGKTGAPVFVASLGSRVEREEYQQLNAAAKAAGGYYSSFRGRGAIPGFQFKTAEARQAFLDAVQGGPAPMFHAGGIDAFYSALERAVAGSQTVRANAGQWKATLKNAPGVKAEELEWSGVIDWLDMQEGQIEKSVLLGVVQAGGIQIDERILGNPADEGDIESMLESRIDEIVRTNREKLEDRGDGPPSHFADQDESGDWRVYGELADSTDFWTSQEEAEDEANRLNERASADFDIDVRNAISPALLKSIEDEVRLDFTERSETQFRGWTSDEMNPSYKELLITLPQGQGGNPDRAPSTHWDNNGNVEAVVAHVRFMEVTDAQGRKGGKIEEVQSDWHQKGRDQGYARPYTTEEKTAAQADFDRANAEIDEALEAMLPVAVAHVESELALARGGLNADNTDPLKEQEVRTREDNLRMLTGRDRDTRLLAAARIGSWADGSTELGQARKVYDAAKLRAEEARQRLFNATGATGIPDAPFKKSWPALVMKRMIVHAVENGWDFIAWTTGDEQNERYNLEKLIDSINYQKNDDGTYRVNFQVRGRGEMVGEALTPEELPGAVGADVARKIIANEGNPVNFAANNEARNLWQQIAGDGLKTGGDGMRAFYDRNLVNITNDLIKKHGGKVGPVITGTEKQLREFAAAERLEANQQRIIDNNEDVTADARARILQDIARGPGRYSDKNRKEVTHHGFEITDALREAVAGGFPLFRPDSPGGMLRFEKSQAKIREIATAQIKQLLPGDRVALEFVEKLQIAPGKQAQGAYWRRVITLATVASYSPQWTVAHESVHAMKAMGLFTPSEWNMLVREVKADKVAFARVRKDWGEYGLTEEQFEEEAIAELFGRYWFDRHVTPKKSWIDRIANRVIQVIVALVRAINTVRGVPSPGVDVAALLRRMERGEIGSRPEGFGMAPSDRPLRGAVVNSFGRRGIAAQGLFDEPAQPERTMTQRQRAELEARQKQGMSRRGGQVGLGDQEGGLFANERDQGKLFQPAPPTKSEAFKRWFGDSKVVDASGEPLVVYHGGDNWTSLPQGQMTWFTDTDFVADGYADQGFRDPRISAVYLKISNPLDLRNPANLGVIGLSPADWSVAKLKSDFHGGVYLEGLRDELVALGYDGVIHYDSDVRGRPGHTSYVTLGAGVQAKSAGFNLGEADNLYSRGRDRMTESNTGAFDPANPDIRYNVAGSINPASPEFNDPDTEARWKEATKGVGDGPGALASAREWWADFTGGFTRHWRALPNEPRFSDVGQQFRKLEAAPDAAKEASVDYLRDLVGSMTKPEYDLFSRKVVLDDLAWEAGEHHELPFGFTPATLKAARQNIDAQIGLSPKLIEAVRKRKAHNKELAEAMVEAGVLTREQIKNPAYFRHMVLDYARHEAAAARGPGSKIKSPYWAKRMGSTLDINANLLEAELDWMLKARVDIATAKTIEWIKKSDHNIRDRLRTQAKAANKAALDEIIAANPAVKKEDSHFRSMIGMGFQKVKDELDAGTVGVIPPHLRQAAADLMANQRDGEMPYALFAWMLDNNKPGAMGAGMVLKYGGLRKAWMRKLLGEKYLNPDDVAGLVQRLKPEGYKAWQPVEGRHLFTAKTMSESALDMFVGKLAETTYPGVDKEELHKALTTIRPQLVVGGDRYTMVLPEEIADTLTEFGDTRAEGMVGRAFGGVQSAWKRWVLINPRRFLKYNINNLSGDLDAIIAGNPGTLRKIGAAWTMLRDAGKGTMAPRYTEALERGVFTSGLSVQEIPDINRLSALRHLTEDRGTVNKLTLGAVAKVWRALQDTTQFRENLFRLAAYLDYAEKIERGDEQLKIGYGASVPRMVDAVSDPKDRAALLARDLVGDYGSISVAGGWLRKYLIPFWSWTEINTKRYWRLTGNAFSQSTARGMAVGGLLGAGITARVAVTLGIRMAMLYGLLYLWNHLLFPDEEDDLGDLQKRQLHIILGRDADGEVVTLRTQGALSDVIGMLGFPDAIAGIEAWQNGQGSIGQAAKDALKAPLNRVATGTTPVFTVPLEQALGKELWPDIFDAREIKDRWRHVFSTFSLEHEYDQIADKPTRGYGRSWTESLIYRRDPAEMAFDDAKGIAYDWLEKVKGQDGSSSTSPRSAALRDYRMALRYGDQESADEALLRYEAVGGTDKGLKASIARQHPLAPIAKKDRVEFLDSLTDEQLETFAEAEEFYNRVYLGADE